MMEELTVILDKRNSPIGSLGFSLLDKPGFPAVIYDIEEHSPAAECGKVVAGDIIVQINDTNVAEFTIKEVLKCLRLSENPVVLRLKRDPVLKEEVLHYLSSATATNGESDPYVTGLTNGNGSCHGTMEMTETRSQKTRRRELIPSIQYSPLKEVHANGVAGENGRSNNNSNRFEAYLMTGERLIKLTKNPSHIPRYQQRKIDSLRLQQQQLHLQLQQKARGKSTPSSPVEEREEEEEGMKCSSTNTSPQKAAFYANKSQSDNHIAKDASCTLEDEATISLNALMAASSNSVTSEASSSCESGKRPPPNGLDPGSSISSPDYEENASDMLINARDAMDGTDTSDTDSTLMASEPKAARRTNSVGVGTQTTDHKEGDHRIVIKVKGADRSSCEAGNETPQKPKNEGVAEYDAELLALTEGAANLAKAISPGHPSAGGEDENGSDAESLHSFHYSPKGVDYPSAVRLAKRLYNLDGFKKSDVSRHLSKNNDYNRAVAEEFLKHFDFVKDPLDAALRKFLKQFCLSGETQERERVLVHFSKRYLDCNPGIFNSQDAVHTLACAIMLLNTDLHGQNIGRKMNSAAFVENLSGLNDGENFPKDVLKSIYHSIKTAPLEWAVDDEEEGSGNADGEEIIGNGTDNMAFCEDSKNGLLGDGKEAVVEYKKGYVLRKCCMEPNGKRTPMGKRGWKMYYITLKDLVLYFHKDDQGFAKGQMGDNLHNAVRLHHSLATKASDYRKKLNVFRLITCDRAEFLFQTSDTKELQSWVDTINLVCASFSAPPLPEPVGSQKKFQRPLLPSAPTKFNLREQLAQHEKMVMKLENDLERHRKNAPDRGGKNLVLQNYREKDAYLSYEIKRYKTYAYLLQSRLPPSQEYKSLSPIPLADIESEEELANSDEEQRTSSGLCGGGGGSTAAATATTPITNARSLGTTNRYSYMAAIYASGGESCGDVG